MRPDPGQYEGTTLRDYLRVVRRRKWIILSALILVPLAAVWFSLRQTPLYEASADVLMGRTNLTASLTGVQDPLSYYRPERVAQTQAELARLPDLAKRVVEAAGVPDRTPEGLLGSSSVTPSEISDVLTFSVVDRSRAAAVRLANAYASEYTRFSRQLETGNLVRAREEVSERIAVLEARGEKDSALYASLVDKEQQLRTIEALQASNSFVVRPTSAAGQTQPRPFRNGILGLALGLMVGLALAFLRDALDTRVRSTDEIERLGMPLLARLPEPRRKLRRADKLVMLNEPNGVQAEAFRLLKTNLDFVNLDGDARVLLVTSAVQSEGKSTTVSNLAVALARSGARVILADLDLRRPILHRFFDLQGRPGVTNVALGHADLSDALTPVALTGVPLNGSGGDNRNGGARQPGSLHVLGSGPIPPDVGEFAGTTALEEIINELRARADFVLLDTPPLLGLVDTRVLMMRADAMLLVARLSVLRKPMLKELARVLEATRTKKLGFVVTGAEQEEGYGYQGYYYRTRERASVEQEPVA